MLLDDDDATASADAWLVPPPSDALRFLWDDSPVIITREIMIIQWTTR